MSVTLYDKVDWPSQKRTNPKSGVYAIVPQWGLDVTLGVPQILFLRSRVLWNALPDRRKKTYPAMRDLR
jgi:hypothetical protein